MRDSDPHLEDYAGESYKHLFDQADEVDEDFVEKNIYPLQNYFQENNPRYLDKVHVQTGGAKKIFKVFDEQTDRYLAYAEPLDDSKEKHEEFFNEARVTASLQHPNIIPVYEIGFQDGIPYFTMEWKQGENLQAKVDRDHGSTCNLDHTIDIFLQVLKAIEYAHSKNVIHCDIKPANIQITDHGDVLVCDWGISARQGQVYSSEQNEGASDSESDLSDYKTMVREIRGTPGFMSPEQADPDKRSVQLSSDIYALGAVLYFMLTGRAPNEGDTLETILDKTREGINPHLLRHFSRNQLSVSLESIVLKALAKDPIERYRAVGDLKNDVLKFKQGYATQAENANLLTLLKLFYHRQKTLCLVTGVFSLSLVSILSYATYTTKKSEQKALASNRQLDQALIEARQQMVKLLHTKMFEKNYFELNKFFRTFFRNHPTTPEQLDVLADYLNDHAFDLHYRTILTLSKYITLADPSRRDMLRLRGLFDMASGRYENAKSAFKHDKGDPFIDGLVSVIDEYSEKKDSVIGMGRWKEIIQEDRIQSHHPDWIKLNVILMHSFFQQEKNHHIGLRILEHLLSIINPSVEEFVLESQDAAGDCSLVIESSDPLTMSYQGESLFRFMQIHELHLKGEGFEVVPKVFSKVQVLDISESRIRDLTGLNVEDSLQTLLIHEGNSYRGLATLPSHINVMKKK